MTGFKSWQKSSVHTRLAPHMHQCVQVSWRICQILEPALKWTTCFRFASGYAIIRDTALAFHLLTHFRTSTRVNSMDLFCFGVHNDKGYGMSSLLILHFRTCIRMNSMDLFCFRVHNNKGYGLSSLLILSLCALIPVRHASAGVKKQLEMKT